LNAGSDATRLTGRGAVRERSGKESWIGEL